MERSARNAASLLGGGNPAVELAQRDRFRNVLGADTGPACEVGDGARDAQHPVIGASRQPKLAHLACQQVEHRRIRAALDGEVIAFEPGVGARLPASLQ